MINAYGVYVKREIGVTQFSRGYINKKFPKYVTLSY